MLSVNLVSDGPHAVKITHVLVKLMDIKESFSEAKICRPSNACLETKIL